MYFAYGWQAHIQRGLASPLAAPDLSRYVSGGQPEMSGSSNRMGNVREGEIN